MKTTLLQDLARTARAAVRVHFSILEGWNAQPSALASECHAVEVLALEAAHRGQGDTLAARLLARAAHHGMHVMRMLRLLPSTAEEMAARPLALAALAAAEQQVRHLEALAGLREEVVL